MANKYRLYQLKRRNADGTYEENVVPSLFSIDAEGTMPRVLVRAGDPDCI